MLRYMPPGQIHSVLTVLGGSESVAIDQGGNGVHVVQDYTAATDVTPGSLMMGAHFYNWATMDLTMRAFLAQQVYEGTWTNQNDPVHETLGRMTIFLFQKLQSTQPPVLPSFVRKYSAFSLLYVVKKYPSWIQLEHPHVYDRAQHYANIADEVIGLMNWGGDFEAFEARVEADLNINVIPNPSDIIS